MTSILEYHKSVRRWIPATVALFGLFAFSLLCVPGSQAQHDGGSASSASSGGGHAGSVSSGATFGGHMTAAPLTGGITPPTGGITPPTGSHVSTHSGNGQHQHHNPNSGSNSGYVYPYLYGYAIPYAVPYASDDNSTDADAQDDSGYQGGPTVFDRRGAGASSYIPPEEDAAAAHAASDMNPPEAESPQDPTTLVFKDGHEIEVGNYAIVGLTLYDLTPGHPRKIALADLDLPATQKENDSHGISFDLPPGAQAN
jgi:hypothetical protein